MKEPLPLAQIQEAVLEFLRGRDDATLFGAHAVNVYAGDPRATQDVDILSFRAEALSEELRSYLADRFHIAVRVHQAGQGQGLRVYQVRKEGNRHLVDLRQVDPLPPSRRVEGIMVLDPASLIASKVIATYTRRGRPKSLSDARDLALLLLTYPELKSESGLVADLLMREEETVRREWLSWVSREILPEEDDY